MFDSVAIENGLRVQDRTGNFPMGVLGRVSFESGNSGTSSDERREVHIRRATNQNVLTGHSASANSTGNFDDGVRGESVHPASNERSLIHGR